MFFCFSFILGRFGFVGPFVGLGPGPGKLFFEQNRDRTAFEQIEAQLHSIVGNTFG